MSDEVVYFSNGTEGRMWMSEWCDRCIHDHAEMHGPDGRGPGCLHIANTLIQAFDPVFIPETVTGIREDGTTWEFDTWSCMEFSRCPCDRGPDDPGVEIPPPPDPNQLALFDADALPPGVWRDVVLDEFALSPVR